MKKERNAFFQNQSASSYFYPTGTMPMGMPTNMSYPMATESNSNFYQGPVLMPVANQTSDYNSEIESRLAKIERQINRLDTRLSKVESELTSNPLGNTNEYTANNMYMV